MPIPPRGILPAIITPFREDESIDYTAWQRHIEFLLASGVHGLFVIGGQGEFFALTEEERVVAARFCVQTVNKRAPVYANVGAVTTGQTVRLAQKAEKDGADFIVVVTPYYIKPSDQELSAHCGSLRQRQRAGSGLQHSGTDGSGTDAGDSGAGGGQAQEPGGS